MTQVHAVHSAAPIPADAFVLDGHELRDGIDLADTSRFGDDIWQLAPINHQDHLSRNILNFPSLPEQFRGVTKELFYALLVGELPTGEIRLKQFSIRSAFTCVKKFLDWAHNRGHHTLASMNDEEFIAYQQWLLQTDLGPSQRGIHRRSARLFWVFRAGLYTDRLSLDPQRLHSWQIDNCQPLRRIENATDRIPEEVISPLLVWALRWVNEFSNDILAARDEWSLLYTAGRPERKATGEKLPSKLAALQQLIDEYRRSRRPLPTNPDGTINRNFLARQLHCENTFLGRRKGRAMLEAAAAELGLADGTYLFTEARARLDGTPWLPRFDYNQTRELARLMQTACYVVIGYLSGMRDSSQASAARLPASAKRSTGKRVSAHNHRPGLQG